MPEICCAWDIDYIVTEKTTPTTYVIQNIVNGKTITVNRRLLKRVFDFYPTPPIQAPVGGGSHENKETEAGSDVKLAPGLGHLEEENTTNNKDDNAEAANGVPVEKDQRPPDPKAGAVLRNRASLKKPMHYR